jgi:hypothetical protein
MEILNSKEVLLKLCVELNIENYIIWMPSGIYSGKICNDFQFEIDKIIEMRVFGPMAEIFLTNVSGVVKYRIREDSESEKHYFLENKVLLRGSTLGFLENILPNNYKSKQVFLKKHEYYEPNEIGQVGYVDSRYVELQIN